MATNVLVLGGGSGGLVAANKVKKLLGDRVEVTLVDKNGHHEFMPAYPWVAFGMREPEQIRRPLANLERRGIRFLQATVEGLDPANNQVKTSAGTLAYDYLIVSLGAEAMPAPAPEGYAPGAWRGPSSSGRPSRASRAAGWWWGFPLPTIPAPPPLTRWRARWSSPSR
jgi:sulfide:quinone oxidoreductase